MGNDLSDFINDAQLIPSNICVIHIEMFSFYGIHLPDVLINGITEIYLSIWNKALTKVRRYGQNVVRFVPHKGLMSPGDNAKNSAKAKQMFCRFHKLFCANGYSLVNSPKFTYRFSVSSWFFNKEINPYMMNTGSVDNEFCAISLSGSDRFQFIDFPQPLQSGIIDCLKSIWHNGVKEPEPIEGTENCWTIQMNGNPWCNDGDEGLNARFLVLTFIRFMSHKSWRLINSTALKMDACDTMFFRHFSKAFTYDYPESFPEYYFILALMGKNYFAVLGANDEIKNAIASSCARHEEKGVESVGVRNNYPVIIMKSHIWSRRDEHEMQTKKLMTLLFQDLALIGWLPVESIDCSRSIKDLSSIAFVNMQPVRMMFFSLSPRQDNSITLINAGLDVQQLITDTFIRCYPIEPHRVKLITYGIASTITLPGSPFRGDDTSGVLLFQQALSSVIAALKNVGWNLILSADTSNETTETGGRNSRRINYSIYSLWFGMVLLN